METNGSSESITFSLPKNQIQWLEQKKKEHPQKPISRWAQEAFTLLMQKEQTRPYDKIGVIFFFLLVGGTLSIFTFLLIPTIGMMFYLFLIISFISLLGGYYALYVYYKEKKRRWISSSG